MIDLIGRSALVTGAAQGIGFGIALELARAGSRVVIADLDLRRASSAAEDINKASSQAIALQLNVADGDSVQQCVETAIEHCGGIDILVNNAGSFQARLGLELNDDEFNRCVDVNLTGMWRMVRAVIPHFRAQRGGRIINIASVGGRQGIDFAPAYCASKAAVINLTQSLAAALGPHNINVNTVCPGSISTVMQKEIKALRARSSDVDNRRYAAPALAGPLSPQDIGYAVVFFASKYASNITGQALNVDCGSVMN